MTPRFDHIALRALIEIDRIDRANLELVSERDDNEGDVIALSAAGPPDEAEKLSWLYNPRRYAR